jgi:hypothetical protein
VLPSELFRAAEADSGRFYVPPADEGGALERLRTDVLAFFSTLPEPPVYRRAEDPLREAAQKALAAGQPLLARAMALTRTAHGPKVVALREALERHLEALCHTTEGRLLEAEGAWSQAVELERAARTVGKLWVTDDDRELPVYDPASGASRYDPQPDPPIRAKLACPNRGCHKVGDYELSPRHAAHRLDCAQCHRSFLAYVAECRTVNIHLRGRARRYVFELVEPTGGLAGLELEDGGGEEFSVARGDRLAFLYSDHRELRAVLNLSSSRLLWLQRAIPCFLATAVFGDGAPELEPFRRFRDQVLMRSMLGRVCVRGYERAGPMAARWVLRREGRRQALRKALEVVHRWLKPSEP